MIRCQCQGIENVFDRRLAAKQLEKTRRRGPQRTTSMLIEVLRSRGVEGKTLLDIGGGIGAIQHELAGFGAAAVTGIDASSAYLEAARAEAERLGYAGRARYFHGDFVDLANAIPPADMVTLDRVICCYDDVRALVTASSEKAQSLYGLVYPRDVWWTRLGIRLFNLLHWIQGTSFRVFAHPTETVESILRDRGLSRFFHRTAGMWQVALYAKGG